MRLFARKDGRKRWKEKALLIDPHKTRIILVATREYARPPHSPPWIHEKLEKLSRDLYSQSSSSTMISMTERARAFELAFASRIRQENNLEPACSYSMDQR